MVRYISQPLGDVDPEVAGSLTAAATPEIPALSAQTLFATSVGAGVTVFAITSLLKWFFTGRSK